jgi:hypothetical protein
MKKNTSSLDLQLGQSNLYGKIQLASQDKQDIKLVTSK